MEGTICFSRSGAEADVTNSAGSEAPTAPAVRILENVRLSNGLSLLRNLCSLIHASRAVTSDVADGSPSGYLGDVIEQINFDSAFGVIKEAVSLNPDYPNVTKIARSFYDEQQDFDSAVELSVNELIRIESYPWFEVLK
ncbi:hypothetical protein, partial [Streptomyces sp. NPDC059744]|uniref:hypothetical protein n=1 Tax=Streptomyces sp. NPDC059744 TaxID=3346929 RepID=UPI0036694038